MNQNSLVRVKDARFVTSAPDIATSPASFTSEIAFLGRSNVGKSSLLNSLMKKKQLAKTSSTPGKTKLINFFDLDLVADEINHTLRLVDLPGFGYAKVSKTQKEEWQDKLTNFLYKRKSIRVFVQLRDSRHPELPQDDALLEFLESFITPDQLVVQVFTKMDKLNRKESDKLNSKYPNAFKVSNLKNSGTEKLLSFLAKSIYGEQNAADQANA